MLLTDQGGFWSEDSPEDNFKLVPVTRLHFVNKHTPTICSAIWQRRLRTLSSASGWVVYAEGNQSVVNHRWPYNPRPENSAELCVFVDKQQCGDVLPAICFEEGLIFGTHWNLWKVIKRVSSKHEQELMLLLHCKSVVAANGKQMLIKQTPIL